MALRHGLAKGGDRIIVTAGVPFGTPGSTNVVHVARLIGDELDRHKAEGSQATSRPIQQPGHQIGQLAGQEADPADLLGQHPPGLAVQPDAPQASRSADRRRARRGRRRSRPARRPSPTWQGRRRRPRSGRRGRPGATMKLYRPLTRATAPKRLGGPAGGGERIGLDLLRARIRAGAPSRRAWGSRIAPPGQRPQRCRARRRGSRAPPRRAPAGSRAPPPSSASSSASSGGPCWRPQPIVDRLRASAASSSSAAIASAAMQPSSVSATADDPRFGHGDAERRRRCFAAVTIWSLPAPARSAASPGEQGRAGQLAAAGDDEQPAALLLVAVLGMMRAAGSGGAGRASSDLELAHRAATIASGSEVTGASSSISGAAKL